MTVNTSRLANATLNNNEIVRLARELVWEVKSNGVGDAAAQRANG